MGYCQIASRPTVVSDGVGLYEVVLRKQENRFLLHIVNLTGAMAKPIDNIVPLYDLSMRLNLLGFGISKDKYNISTVRGGVIKNILSNAEEVSFTLEKLTDYEVIVIE